MIIPTATPFISVSIAPLTFDWNDAIILALVILPLVVVVLSKGIKRIFRR